MSVNITKRILPLAAFLLMVLSLTAVLPATVLANGGSIVYNGDTGPFNVVTMMNPSPANPTVPLHFDVIVTKRGSDQRVTSATITVNPSMPGMEMPGMNSTRLTQSFNRPNQYEIDIPLSMEGRWRFEFTLIDPALGSTNFVVDTNVAKPDAPWPIIIGILVGLPVLAGLTWFFLFKGNGQDDDDEEEEAAKPAKAKARS